MRVGSDLKAARKKTGISLEVISKRTKIQVSKLVALEKNDFKNLPTGLYLFAVVRAYAREVHIDPEPIVERLRTEFADKDALDALQALDATGALNARNSAGPGRSKDGQPKVFRTAAIAAGIILMAAAGAGAYLHKTGRIAHEVHTTLSSPAPAATVASAVDVPQQVPVADPAPASQPGKPAPAKTYRSKPRAAAVAPGTEEPASAETPANIEELVPEAPVVAAEQ